MNSPTESDREPGGVLRGVFLEIGRTVALAIPIMAGFLGQMLMGIADTVMIGRVGTVPLAAAALGHNLFNVPMVAGFGLLSAVGVLVSHAYGGKRPEAAAQVLRQGVLFAVVFGLVTGLGFWWLRSRLGWLRQPEAVLAEAQVYLLLMGWSMVPALVAHTLKQHSEALTRVWPPMFILLGGVLLNILLNWLWIFGHFGFPAMGLAGAGWATFAARVATAVGLALYLFRNRAFAAWRPVAWWGPWNREVTREIWKLGLPVGLQHVLEVGAFVTAALFMGWISPEAMAAHQIAITCAATTFMLSLGVGMAVSIRVGHAYGARDRVQLRRVGLGGLALTAGFMSVCGVMFMVGGNWIAGWFTPDESVVVLAAGMLVVAALFQVFDGMQVVALCALRGMTDVRAPAVIAAVAYWLVALPLGYMIGFPLGQGPVGVWIGLAVGLGVAAGALIWRFDRMSCVGRTG